MKYLKFNNVYIKNNYMILGSLEKNPTIAKNVDKVIEDYYLDTKCPEDGEAKFQNLCVNGLMKKINMKEDDIDLMIGGDLENELFASNFNATNYKTPFFGVYSACASFVEAMIISSSMIEGGLIENSICVTSSSNLVSEKQFRFPIEYGALRKKVNSFTATGAVSALLTNKKTDLKIEGATIGRIIDMGHTDTNDMGACMAPGVAETLYDHFLTTNRNEQYYDIILTGDLGVYGLNIMKEYLYRKYKIKLENVYDAGAILYNSQIGGEFAGGSGPICAPMVLFANIIKKYKKILVVASGALHSTTSANLAKIMPGVGHAISLEVLK